MAYIARSERIRTGVSPMESKVMTSTNDKRKEMSQLDISGNTEMFIDNRQVRALEYQEVRDPGKISDIVGMVGYATPREVDFAVQAAERAFTLWSTFSVNERIEMLEISAKILEELSGKLAPLLVRENGAKLSEAEMDISRGATLFRKTLEIAGPFLASRHVESQQDWLEIEKKPVGVTALIVPWNSPIVLTMGKLAPALVAGNTVVLKPSPYAPLTLTRCLSEMAMNLPSGVVNVVNGGVETGKALLEHPRVRKISFTGGVSTGKQVMASAASNIKKISLELGGNDPAIILDDADIEGIISRLCQGVFTRAGQICFAVKRIYVPKSKYESFFQAMREEVDSYLVGHGLDDRITFGPLINEIQFRRINELVQRTKDCGATVTELGAPANPSNWDQGYYVLPKIVTNIDPQAEIVQEEQFGPIIPLVSYDDIDQAVHMSNDSEYGLSASVWSSDFDRALGVARRLEAGATFINSHNIWSLSLDMPMGGVKQSGLGRERTELGLQEYVEDHAIRFIKQQP